MATKTELQQDLNRKVIPSTIPRVSLGNPKSDPYMMVVTLTRRTGTDVPENLVEIQITRAPGVSAERAEDVIRHAMIDVFGSNPPVHVAPDGRISWRWFDHLGPLASKAMPGHVSKPDSLWIVLTSDYSAVRRSLSAMSYLANQLWSHLIERHKSLRAE